MTTLWFVSNREDGLVREAFVTAETAEQAVDLWMTYFNRPWVDCVSAIQVPSPEINEAHVIPIAATTKKEIEPSWL